MKTAAAAAGVFVIGGLCLAQGDDIRMIEQALVGAVRAAAGLERFYAPEYAGIDRTGVKSDVKAALAIKPDPNYALNDFSLRTYGNSAVAVGTHRVEGGRAVRFLHVWVKQSDEWRLVASQVTAVASDTSYTAAPSSVVATPRASPTGPADRSVLAAENALLKHVASNAEVDARALKIDESTFVRHTGALASTFEDSKAVPLSREIVSWDRVQSYGDIAIVQGTLLWTDTNGFSPGQLRFTRVWVRQDGAWKVAAEQHTSIAGP